MTEWQNVLQLRLPSSTRNDSIFAGQPTLGLHTTHFVHGRKQKEI
jgi:hypothetical protein